MRASGSVFMLMHWANAFSVRTDLFETKHCLWDVISEKKS